MRDDLIERLRIAAKIHRDIGGQSALAATIEEAAAALEAAREDGWKPIETAPKDGASVLLYYPDSGVIEGMWYERCGGQWSVVSIDQHGCGCCSDDRDRPTAWMPLPAPPEVPHD